MATKQWPSLPEWASGGTKVEPTAAKKASGWVGGGEKPPYQTFNWWQDNVYQNVEYIKSIVDPHLSLQAAIESAITGGVRTGGNIPPRYVSSSYKYPLQTTTPVISGAYPAAASSLVSADGRYVCTPTDVDDIGVFNQSDGSFFATITLAAPPAGSITAISSNGYYVAVAYDGKIDLFDISTQALEHTYVHSANGPEVRDMELLSDNYIIFVADAATLPLTGSTPQDHNMVVVDSGGALLTSIIEQGGGENLTKMAWWRGNIAFFNATTGNVGVCRWNENLGIISGGGVNPPVWSTSLAGWTAVQGLAINESGVAVVGRDTATTSRIEIYSVGGDNAGAGQLIASDTTFGAPGFDMTVECDDEHFFVTADSGVASPLSSVIVYDVSGSTTNLVRIYEYQFNSTVLGAMSASSTDFMSFYVLQNAGASRALIPFGLGVGPGMWNISNGVEYGLGVSGYRQAAYPIRFR